MARSSARASPRVNGPVGLDRDDLRATGLAPSRARDGADPGHDRGRRGRRLPDARPRRDRRRPAAVRAARVRGPDAGTGSLEAPGLPRDARGRPARAAPFAPPTSRRWRPSTRAATGEDRRAPARRPSHAPDTTRVLDERRRRARRVRRPGAVGRRRDDRAPSRRRAGDPDARRVAAGPDHPVRAGLLAENEGGLAVLLADGWTARGARRVWCAATRCAGSPTRSGASSTTPSADRPAGPRSLWSKRHPGRPPKGSWRRVVSFRDAAGTDPTDPPEHTRPMWPAIRRARRRPRQGSAAPARTSGGDPGTTLSPASRTWSSCSARSRSLACWSRSRPCSVTPSTGPTRRPGSNGR